MRPANRLAVYDAAQPDIPYCASSYLMHRAICDEGKCFSKKFPPRLYPGRGECDQVHTGDDLIESIGRQVREACSDGKAALALSGGIDSAIMAKFMPENSKAYTFKCVVPGVEVTDETAQAACYAVECGLDHEVIEVYWEDAIAYTPALMAHKGAPIHSIEFQIYKCALKAKADGFERVIFGESADNNYGGMSGLVGGVWTLGEYVDRYSYIMPYKVLKEYRLVLEPYIRHCGDDGYVDPHEHCRHEFFREAMGTYINAAEAAGMEMVTPYANTWMATPMDFERIRAGEGKYIIRDAFRKLYPGWDIPVKLPMPRPTDEWMANWEGPTRGEFWPRCTDRMSGDQKWMVWSLERFLDMIDDVSERQ